MSIIGSRMDHDESPRGGKTESPIIGKVSIGIPADEPMLVEHAEGKKLVSDVTFGNTKIPSGKTLQEHHIEKMQEAGIREVHVHRGRFPRTLNYFRVLRNSNISEGYVEDPKLYDKYGLDPGPGLTEIPIMLTSENIDQVIQTRLLNYDRSRSQVFCSSADGEEATRQRINGDDLTDHYENHAYTGGDVDINCAPFHWGDNTVPFSELADRAGVDKDTIFECTPEEIKAIHEARKPEEQQLCPYREYDQDGKQDCDFTGSFYFNILNEDGDFSLGRYFKLETTSSKVIEKYHESLLNPDTGIKQKFGRISFVPMKLEILREKTERSGGRYEDGRIPTKVERTTLSTSEHLLDKYRPVIEDMLETLDDYRSMNSMVPGVDTGPSGDGGPKRDPTDIPNEGLPDEEERRRWASEFNPEEHQERLKEEGVETDIQEQPDAVSVADEGHSEGEETGAESEGAYEWKRRELFTRARRLPPKRYEAFTDNKDRITKDNIDKWSSLLDEVLSEYSEEQISEHVDQNSRERRGENPPSSERQGGPQGSQEES
ncbi:hypothetical protein [Salinibacter ruber]|uniref:Uncharacterized protein n=1 Tax=Salinibacter ruber TaxID=146919 RepID=A0AAW5P898_9BACT|nr:hypothetical protein [Salinibacter ruber]MCS4157620.1 hypothetical protein [Salinibacter ruber]